MTIRESLYQCCCQGNIFGVPNTLNAFRHYKNRLKAFKTPIKGPSYRCFRSFRPQVEKPEFGPGAREVLVAARPAALRVLRMLLRIDDPATVAKVLAGRAVPWESARPASS